MASSFSSPSKRDFSIPPGSVKIDGLRTVEQALVAAEAGAEIVGLIFAPGRRQVTADLAQRISDAVHSASPGVRVIGVFVDASAEAITETAQSANLDLVQLHGDEPPEMLDELEFPAIKAFRALPGERAEDLVLRIRPYLRAKVPPNAILIDGYDPKAHGGTGVRADWDVVAAISTELGLSLGVAGGLNPDNVGSAISVVRPRFVDISSGVEVDGIKDDALIRRFIERADAAFRDAETIALGAMRS